MILFEDRNIRSEKVPFKGRYQIKGTQNWIYDYPIGLFSRCHKVDNGIAMEGLQTIGASHIMDEAFMYLLDNGNDDALSIQDIWDEKIQRQNLTFSDEDIDFFIKNGFIGLMGVKCPELKDNETFQFYAKIDLIIRKIEDKMHGKSSREVIDEIDRIMPQSGSKDYDVWKLIRDAYDSQFSLGDSSPLRTTYCKYYSLQNLPETSKQETTTGNNTTTPINQDDEPEL